MTIHFICRGNVLRSIIAETYVKSLQLPDVYVSSSGTNVHLDSEEERGFFTNTIEMLSQHHIESYAKNTSHQLTQERADNQDTTVCMNQIVIDEAQALVKLPSNKIVWDIVDIGEGYRATPADRGVFENEIYNEVIARVDSLLQELKLR